MIEADSTLSVVNIQERIRFSRRARAANALAHAKISFGGTSRTRIGVRRALRSARRSRLRRAADLDRRAEPYPARAPAMFT
jgi:hypothetical protein